MSLYRYYPPASDRMGTFWSLCSIEGAYIIEFGPSGNTSFAPEGIRSLNAQLRANVFTTHITENDLALGKIDNLAEAIKEVDGKYGPDIIFILASSLVAVTGADIVGICAEIQSRVKARLIPADKGGYLGDHTYGIRSALKLLCSQVAGSAAGKISGGRRYNIIGSNIDYYNYRADAQEIKRLLKKYFSLECGAVFTSECSMKDIYSAGDADFNVVMRSEAIDAAEVLRERFGQPYVFGRPYGIGAAADFLQALSQTIGENIDKDILASELEKCREVLFDFKMRLRNEKIKAMLLGNYDLVSGMGGFLKEAGFDDVLGIVNHKLKGGNYEGNDNANIKINPSEEEIGRFLSDFEPDVILGDAVLLEMSKDIEKAGRYQVSNPNIDSFRFYDGAPFIGFNGVIYLCEALCNIVHIKNGHGH